LEHTQPRECGELFAERFQTLTVCERIVASVIVAHEFLDQQVVGLYVRISCLAARSVNDEFCVLLQEICRNLLRFLDTAHDARERTRAISLLESA